MFPVLLCLLVSSAVLLADPVPHASFKLGTEEVTWLTLSIWTSQPSTVSIHCPVARPVCSTYQLVPQDNKSLKKPALQEKLYQDINMSEDVYVEPRKALQVSEEEDRWSTVVLEENEEYLDLTVLQ
ncbi:hypothetical protein E2320_003936 [Naja naja]|nr:hypothetical protein E2320_003936 [Naja naja]